MDKQASEKDVQSWINARWTGLKKLPEIETNDVYSFHTALEVCDHFNA